MFVCVMSSFGFNEHVAISIVIKYVSNKMVYDVYVVLFYIKYQVRLFNIK